MYADEILQYCLNTFQGTVLVESWGEKGIFYNPNHVLKRGVYILTVKEKDGENDKGSNLDRNGVWRLNIGLRKNTFKTLFGNIPARPAKSQVVNMEYDFTILDTLLPHPVYAWMGWVSILNPSENSFDKLKPLMNEAYEFAKEKFAKRK